MNTPTLHPIPTGDTKVRSHSRHLSKNRSKGWLTKIFKYFLIVFAGFTLSFGFYAYIRSPRTGYHYANNGKIICVEVKKDMITNGDLTCMGIVPLGSGIDTLLQNVNNLDSKGEIILKKP